MCATMKPVYTPTGMDPDMWAPLIMEILAARAYYTMPMVTGMKVSGMM